MTLAADRTKKFFGVGGLAYNVLLNPVDKKDSKEKEKPGPSIVLSDDNFTTDESILIDPDEDEQEEQEGPLEPETETKAIDPGEKE